MNQITQRTCLPFLTTALLAIGWTLAIGQSATRNGGSPNGSAGPSANSHQRATPDANESKVLVREGTELRDRRGHFEFTGDLAVFVDDDGMRFGGLKNLSMERVVETLRATRRPEDFSWTVSGVVTEFAGRNYLLMNRVVRRSLTPDRPERGTRRPARPEDVGRAVVDTGPPLPTMGSTSR